MTPEKGKFSINRQISLEKLDGITESTDMRNPELVLHFYEDHDERLIVTGNRHHIVRLLLMVTEGIGRTENFGWWRVPIKKLTPYRTLKPDVVKSIYRRPDQEFAMDIPQLMRIVEEICDPSTFGESSYPAPTNINEML